MVGTLCEFVLNMLKLSQASPRLAPPRVRVSEFFRIFAA